MTRQKLLIAAVATLGFSTAYGAAKPAPYLGVTPVTNTAVGKHFATAVCASCHGVHGNSVSPTFPNLAGQSYNYLLKQMENFRSGARKVVPMNAMIATIPQAPGDANLKAVAAYFAKQPLNRKIHFNATAPKPTMAQVKLGYKVFQQGLPGSHVPACAACHTDSGAGIAPMAIPSLAGQHAAYIENELGFFANGKRTNSPHHIMAVIAKRLTPAEIKAVALYAQQLQPDLMPGSGPKTYEAYVKALADQAVPGVPRSAVQSAKTTAKVATKK